MRMKPLDSDSANIDPEISVFLLLCAEHQRLVEGIAVRCREVVPSDPFIPHMTTYFGLGAPVLGRQGLVERIAQVTGPVSQQFDGIGGESRFWRASYIALRGGPQLEAIDAALKREITPYGPYSLFPHLSLVYSNEITSFQQATCRLIAESALREARVSELIFDRVGLFQRHSPDGAWEDVSRWREICSASFHGAQ